MNDCNNDISFFWEDVEEIEFNCDKVIKWIQKVVNAEGSTFGFFNIIFCSDEFLLDMNKKYLNHDYYTDIITFDYNDDDCVSGDLFISVDRVHFNASEYNSGFYEELYRVIVHGVLHVLGYSDKTDSEVKTMRKKENAYLKFILE